MNLETEGKISQAVPNFLKHYYFHIKQPIFLITHITHTRMQMTTQSLYKYIIKFLKIDFLKTTGIAKDDIKVSVILAKKYEVKAKIFIIPVSFYGNKLAVTPRSFPSLFLFLSSPKPFSRHQKSKKQ